MKENTCCFTGHRELPESDIGNICKNTALAVKKLIERGVKTFICGGAIGFDMMCGELIMQMKEDGAHINFVMALPCMGQEKYYCDRDKERYKKLVNTADKVIYISEKYHRSCMHMRNCFMVDNSAYIIAYCTRLYGGSANTLSYALQKGIEIIDIK